MELQYCFVKLNVACQDLPEVGLGNANCSGVAMIEDVIRFTSAANPIWFSAQPTALDRLDSTLRGHIFISELLRPWFYFVFMELRTLSASQKTIARYSEMSFQDELSRLYIEAGLTYEENAHLRAAHCVALIQDWYVKRWKYQ